jgi:methylenetetrahydrofolate dehydrogenase (NADP+) / methenyltetrahydrofolate cyclohydrolase
VEKLFGATGVLEVEAKPAEQGQTAQILEGRTLAKQLREGLKAEVAEFKEQHGFAPGFAVVLVGDDGGSVAYTRTLTKTATELGLYGVSRVFPASTTLGELQHALAELNADPQIHGVAVQWPTPPHISFENLTDAIDPRKDVDGYHPLLVGRLFCGLDSVIPATPHGGMKLLEHYGFSVAGKNCLLIGNGVTVGRPLLALLLRAQASVTVATKATPPHVLRQYAAQADMIFSAAGVPGMLKGDMVKPGVVVIDFGTSVVGEKLTGDADFESLLPVARAITPTPGGTGPVTNVMLMSNVLKAARKAVVSR